MKERIANMALVVAASFLGGLLASSVMGGLPLYAESPHNKTIRAKQFAVVDSNGVRRGQWGVADNGVYFVLFDPDGQTPRVALKLDPTTEAGLVIYRPQGVHAPSITLGTRSNKGDGDLRFFRSNGTASAALGVLPTGKAAFVLLDENEEITWGAP